MRRITIIILLFVSFVTINSQPGWYQISTSGLLNGIYFCWYHMDTVWLQGKTNVYGIPASEKKSEFLSHILRNRNFSFFISMPDDTLLECERIHVILHIKNTGDANDSLPNIEEWSDISIINENTGKTLPPKSIWDSYKISYMYFAPNEERIFDFNIDWVFADTPLVIVTNQRGVKQGDCYYIRAGRYSVVIGKKGNISNKVYFEIIKPKAHDLVEMNELSTAYNNLDERYRIDKFHNFLVSNPNSNYDERALFELTMLTNYYTSNDWINLLTLINKWFENIGFEKDTESEFVKGLIGSLVRVNKTTFAEAKKEVKDYLNKIISDHPGTLISRWVQAYLDKF